MGIVVGIDLGTTYSAVARVDAATGRAEVIPNADGGAVTPSVVAVSPEGNILFGTEAKEQQELGYTDTAAFFKRYMGQAGYTVGMGGRDFTPVDLSGMLLQGLVHQAEQVSGEEIDGAYITVPAYFKNSEREATIEAGRRAGINVMGILNEPTAAAFAYGLNGKDAHQKVLIYDLGGGTFDVTLAEVDGDSIRILGSDGSHILGGKDWDDAVARWIAEQFEDEFGVDLTSDEEELAKLTVAAENAKKRLTKAPQAVIPVSFEGHRGKYTLDRETFDDVTSYMLQETSDIVDRLFASFKPAVTWDDVDGAILVGGSTRMLQVHDYIEKMSGKPPLGGVNVDEAVALGAAIRANQDASGNARPQLMTIGGGHAPSGAPRMLIGGKRITDATSHALGMIAESANGERYINDVLIAKNTAIPAANTHHVTLRVPRSGGEMEVYLLQGAERRPLDNDVAGKYVFSDIPYVQSGSSNIDVTYSYDENGVIQVSALQRETGNQLIMHREPVPDDMSWTDRSPKENQPQGVSVSGEVYLLIDLSGSMDGSPLRQAIQSAHDFANQLDLSMFSIGVAGFGSYFVNVQSLTHFDNQVHGSIDRLNNKTIRDQAGYGTDNPLGNMRSLFSGDPGAKLVIILTDGSWGGERRAIEDAHQLNSMGIDTIGVGISAANAAFLREISSLQDLSGLTDLSHLSESFSKIARVISA
ncbi:Hsp70 family protein [Bifidobacterium longum]|uniref:Hsp70 family protein n=1 Tax=Bifidobacterium longum TaxID=216816 RepID=UPI0013C2D74C|nr:Hsp70 family protein [Bifidobacterium longum]